MIRQRRMDRLVALLLGGLAVGAGLGLRPVAAQGGSGRPVVKVLTSFEGPVDMDRGPWRSNVGGRAAADHVTHGRQSLRISFGREDALLWASFGAYDNDWSSFEKLKADVAVDDQPLILSIQLTDEAQNWYTIPYYYLRPGPNTIEIDLEGAAQVLNLTRISELHFRAIRQATGRTICYFDSIRLTRGVADSVPEELAQMSQLPQMVGSLVANPSFEYGLDGWQFWGHFDWGQYAVGTASGKEARSGTTCATIRVRIYTPGRGGLASARIWIPQPGRYRATVFVKGTDNAVFRFGVANAHIESAAVDVKVTDRWQELTYLVEVPDDRKPVRLWLYNVGMGTLYIDDVAFVSEGPAGGLHTSSVPEGRADVRLKGELMYVNGEPFYPVGIVGCKSPEADLAQTPFNLAVASLSSSQLMPFLDRCYAAGVMGLANLSESLRMHLPGTVTPVARHVASHPSVLGWLLGDEPDGEAHPIPPPEVRLAQQRVTAAVGTERPVLLRLENQSISSFYQYRGLSDVLLVTARSGDVQRPLDVSEVTRPLSQARKMLKGERPVWVVLGVSGAKDLEPAQLSALAYLAVAHGAKGILWEPFSYFKERPALWGTLIEVGGELRQLTPALLSPVAHVITGTNKTTMHGTVRHYQDKLYLIVVNASPEPQPGTQLTLKDVPQSAPVEVLLENRTLTLEGGVLTDDFGPYQRHVYVLTVGPGAPASESPGP